MFASQSLLSLNKINTLLVASEAWHKCPRNSQLATDSRHQKRRHRLTDSSARLRSVINTRVLRRYRRNLDKKGDTTILRLTGDSKIVLQSQLNDSWIHSERGDLPEASGPVNCTRVRKLRRVERVKQLDSELKISPFVWPRNAVVLDEGDIRIVLDGPVGDSHDAIAEACC